MGLPHGWETGSDPNGRTYYVHHATKTTQWDPPTESPVARASASAPPEYRAVTASPAAYVAVAEPVRESYSQHQTSGHHAHPAAITQQPGGGQTVVVVERSVGGANPPPGAPPGGMWVQEKYCGLITWIVAIFVCCCVCCCPCDDRTVYVVNGIRYNTHGAVIQDGC